MVKNDVQDEKLCELKEKAKANADRIAWLEQHYSTFNSEMGEVRNNTKWIIKMVWWHIGVTISSTGGLLALLLNHIIQ